VAEGADKTSPGSPLTDVRVNRVKLRER